MGPKVAKNRTPNETRKNKKDLSTDAGETIPKVRKPRATRRRVVPEEEEEVPEIQEVPEIPEMVEEDNCKTKRTGINAFLAEKERIEYAEYSRNPVEPGDPRHALYPDINDPTFLWRIASRKEFQETKYDDTIYDIRKQSDAMCDSKFELLPHQLFIKNFLSIHTPYNSLLLYHGLGTGKTCTAIGVAEETRKYMAQMGVRERILVVASPNVQSNFRTQLFNESKLVQIQTSPDEFTWNIEACVGDSLLKEIDPNSAKNIPREKLITNIQTIINTWYEFMGYGQLANYITHKTKVNEDAGFTLDERKTIELRKIRNAFNNKTIIIDEVHNITQTTDSKHKTTGTLLMRVAKYAVNMRLLLLSATPMFDTYKEIIWLANLMNTNDKRSQIEISDVFDSEGNIKEVVDKEGSCGAKKETGRELLLRKLTGYVSYVRGENPYTFPFRVYPDIFAPEHTFQSGIPYPTKQMNDKPVTTPLKHIPVYLNTLSANSYQWLAYDYILQTIRQKSRITFGDLRETNQFDMLQKPVECLNIVYPNDEFERMLRKPTTSQDQFGEGFATTILGETGLQTVLSRGDKSGMRSPKFEYKSGVVEKYGRIFSPNVLSKYSKKMSSICDIIRKTEGIVLIYSQYIDGGVVPMALALEEMGFSKWGEGATLFHSPPTEPLDATTMLPRSQVPHGNFHPANYIMITGNKTYSPNNALEIAQAKSKENADGSRVKVILISKAGSEGLDFKYIRQIHILEPWYNMNRIEQIIGRGVRNLSHCGGLPFEKRNVQLYLHGTLFEDSTEEPVDLYIYRIAERKAIQIGKVSRLLKTISVDCALNVKGQNNMTAEKLMSIAENQKVEVVLATKERIALRVGDQPYTDICDYMETCDYKCNGSGSLDIPPNELIQTTYTTDYASSNVYSINQRIREIFREQSAYKRDQLIRLISIRKPYPIEHILYALSLFIENPNESIVDKYDRTGYLVNRGEYYLFQPTEITDEQTSVFERTMPVDYTRSELTLEIPKEVSRVVPAVAQATSVATKAQATKAVAPAVAQAVAQETPEIATSVATQSQAVATQETSAKAQAQAQATKAQETAPSSSGANIVLENIARLSKIAEAPPTYDGKPKMEKNWYRNCGAVREHIIEKHSISAEQLLRYIIHHILDEIETDEKMMLVNYFYGISRVAPANPYEKWIIDYLDKRMVRNASKNKWGIILVEKTRVVLYSRSLDSSSPEWTISEESEYTYFKTDIANMIVDKKKLNQLIGYIMMFKDTEMSFKYKDITMLRNKVGARCDSAGKADTLKLLTSIVESPEMYTQENTKTMFQPQLCVILEILLRHYTDTQRNGRIYYLTPEESILNEIAQYSVAK